MMVVVVDILPITERPVRVRIAGNRLEDIGRVIDGLDREYEADDIALVSIDGAEPWALDFDAFDTYLPEDAEPSRNILIDNA